MMPVYQKSLGDTVRKARHKAKLSQSELAEVLGIGLRTVGDIKNYRSNLMHIILKIRLHYIHM